MQSPSEWAATMSALWHNKKQKQQQQQQQHCTGMQQENAHQELLPPPMVVERDGVLALPKSDHQEHKKMTKKELCGVDTSSVTKQELFVSRPPMKKQRQQLQEIDVTATTKAQQRRNTNKQHPKTMVQKRAPEAKSTNEKELTTTKHKQQASKLSKFNYVNQPTTKEEMVAFKQRLMSKGNKTNPSKNTTLNKNNKQMPKKVLKKTAPAPVPLKENKSTTTGLPVPNKTIIDVDSPTPTDDDKIEQPAAFMFIGRKCVGTIVPTLRDIFAGRGRRSQQTPGNQYFLEVVRLRQHEYRRLPRREKQEVVVKTLKIIEGDGRRFLKEIPLEGGVFRYEFMPRKEIRNKVAHAFRDAHRNHSLEQEVRRLSKTVHSNGSRPESEEDLPAKKKTKLPPPPLLDDGGASPNIQPQQRPDHNRMAAADTINNEEDVVVTSYGRVCPDPEVPMNHMFLELLRQYALLYAMGSTRNKASIIESILQQISPGRFLVKNRTTKAVVAIDTPNSIVRAMMEEHVQRIQSTLYKEITPKRVEVQQQQPKEEVIFDYMDMQMKRQREFLQRQYAAVTAKRPKKQQQQRDDESAYQNNNTKAALGTLAAAAEQIHRRQQQQDTLAAEKTREEELFCQEVDEEVSCEELDSEDEDY